MVVLLVVRVTMCSTMTARALKCIVRRALQCMDAVVVILASLRWDVKFVVTTIDAIINHAMAEQTGRYSPTASVGNV